MNDEFTSNAVWNTERSVKLIRTIIAKNENDLYITKLLKLLFYFDFILMKIENRSFTGDVYYKLPYGPVPSVIKENLDLLKTENTERDEEGLETFNIESIFSGKIEANSMNGGYILKNIGDFTVDSEFLSENEDKLIDKIIETFKEDTVKDIVDKTHDEKPYIGTRDGLISYNLAHENDFPKHVSVQ